MFSNNSFLFACYIYIYINFIKISSILFSLKFSDRVESQHELFDKLEDIFGKDKYLDLKKFKSIIEEVNSDIYVFLLIFILENRPFKKQTIEYYLGCLKNLSKSPPQTTHKLIASPTTNSKFSPSQFLSNSPVMKNKKLKEKTGLSMLNKYVGGKKNEKSDIINLVSTDSKEKQEKEPVMSTTGPVRKNIQFLKNLENDQKPKSIVKDYDENDQQFNFHEAKKFEVTGNVNKMIGLKEEKDEESLEIVQFEGYISKITETQKLKKLWFKLYDKDLFCKK